MAQVESTEIFTYDKEFFEITCMIYFKDRPAKETKAFIWERMDTSSETFKKDVYKRIMNYKFERDDWWVEDYRRDVQTDGRLCRMVKELVAIWKLAHGLLNDIFEITEGGIEGFFHRELEKAEKRLADNEINEQKYIQACNGIAARRKYETALSEACACSAIGSANFYEDIGHLRICCLPCMWNTGATCVRFSRN